MVYIYDLEVYPNLFVGIWKPHAKNDYKIFVIWEHEDELKIDDRQEMFKFLATNPNMVGYNCVKYDSQILEYMTKNPTCSLGELKEFSNNTIDSKWPTYPEWSLSTKQLDPFKIWHYDNKARITGLKWLEFMFRMRSIKDLPFPHDKMIISQRQVDQVIAYCKHDLKPTEEFFNLSKDRILLRQRLNRKFGLNFTNKPDSTLGEMIALNALSIEMNIPMDELKKMRTQRDSISMKDLVFDHYPDLPILNQVIEEHFNKITVHSEVSDKGNKIFNYEPVPKYTYDWNGTEVVYAMGGIHGCAPKGVYESDDNNIIMSCDVVGEYVNIIIQNNLYPAHLGPEFTRIFKEKIADERKKWPKKTHRMLNLTYKLAGNAVYGKLKSEYSGLYDPMVAATIVVNGQLSKTLLGEMLTREIPDSKLLMLNTDGLEIIIPKEYQDLYMKICEKWEKITKLQLEHESYKKLVIDSVNHYIGFYTNGKVKRKGSFYIWDDYLKFEEYHKNASATIIPEAIFEYFDKGISPSDTVAQCEDIFKFCYGTKKQKGFDYRIFIADHNRRTRIKKISDRVLRYYVAKEPSTVKKYQSGSLYKSWNDGRITGLQTEAVIRPLQHVRSLNMKNHQIDYDWYINEAYKIINNIEGMEEI